MDSLGRVHSEAEGGWVSDLAFDAVQGARNQFERHEYVRRERVVPVNLICSSKSQAERVTEFAAFSH